MCGLFGIFYPRAGRVNPEILLRYARIMEKRGPDAEGWWSDDTQKIGLAFRRLAIIDLKTGNQPMLSADGKFAIVFNGEIYNYRELRAILQGKGHNFRTQSDTEVILASYREWGTDGVTKLRGMFAFALVDLEAKRIVLARDPFGIKPLYYLRFPSLIAFASQLDPLLKLAAEESISPEINQWAIQEYLRWGYVPSPHTPYAAIYKLPPATIGMISWATDPHAPEVSSYRYWRMPWEPEADIGASWQEALGTALSDSVRAHLVADVPVGAFLSGGLDSSTVVALAATDLKRSGQPPLRTFSVVIRAFGFSEARYIRAVAHAFPVKPYEQSFSPADLQRMAPDIPATYDEPFADPSAIPTRLICKVARETSIKTVLSGDGGDELFGGYGRYVKALARLRGRKTDEVIREFVDGMRWFSEPEIQALMGDSYISDGGEGIHETVLEHNRHLPLLTRLQDLDLNTYLPENNLTKVDRASMAESLEVRVPLLDPRVASVVGRLPPQLRVEARERKVALKAVMNGVLPPMIIRRGKRGFSVPLARWLRGPFRKSLEDRLLSSRLERIFVRKTLEQKVRAFRGMGKKGATRLWNLYCLAHWFNRYG
jgi:asparagine synthase (glutamine-hydrolysing)